jgi:hypothetical protein
MSRERLTPEPIIGKRWDVKVALSAMILDLSGSKTFPYPEAICNLPHSADKSNLWQDNIESEGIDFSATMLTVKMAPGRNWEQTLLRLHK